MGSESHESFYQTVNFVFSIQFNWGDKTSDIKFQSLSGLESTLETETIKEGGENGFEHVLPLRRKYSPLILKRGVMKPNSSGLTRWLINAFEHEIIEPIDSLVITLLGEAHQPIMHWTVNNVWPRSWKIADLDAMKGDVLIETLELNYNNLLFREGKKNGD